MRMTFPAASDSNTGGVWSGRRTRSQTRSSSVPSFLLPRPGERKADLWPGVGHTIPAHAAPVEASVLHTRKTCVPAKRTDRTECGVWIPRETFVASRLELSGECRSEFVNILAVYWQCGRRIPQALMTRIELGLPTRLHRLQARNTQAFWPNIFLSSIHFAFFLSFCSWAKEQREVFVHLVS